MLKKRHFKISAIWHGVLVAAGLSFLLAVGIPAQTNTANATKATPRDGQCDFDFELGTWKIHLKKLEHPLTGSTTWVEFDGTSVTRKVWDGRAQLEEFETDGAAGHIEGLTLRLYNPKSHQFKDGVGEFYDQEEFNGRTIFVRYIWSRITPNTAHFEQSFSTDGGKTWEVNWITDQTRVDQASKKIQ